MDMYAEYALDTDTTIVEDTNWRQQTIFVIHLMYIYKSVTTLAVWDASVVFLLSNVTNSSLHRVYAGT